ncbi:MAG: hypothetical protein E7D48_04210 [Bifidobacterium scardovii]|jgi:hypothetical protein|uniref:hypothetical protein n=1 Tax=Bifidobacterium scardovii TaxID=158787 RepID=UPI00205042F7|nr:hypothetical protein [Bifidobacterium scardovii]MDU2421305.1 hypothetical protein [Bifidobacterium scardovii]DAZ29451.1 MAG TPA: tail protein [Caudoviricetes sp.]
MRISLISDDDVFRLSTVYPRQENDAWITDKGITGLFGAVPPREKGTDRPQMDGAYWPSRLTAGGRTITVHAAAICRSSASAVLLRDRLRALTAKPLTIQLEDTAGIRRMSGWLADDPEPTMLLRDRVFEFSLILYCPDPLQYGLPVDYTAAGGVIRVLNEGMLSVWPVILASNASRLTVSLAGRKVTWSGSASQPLTLDMADMIPSQGTVSYDFAFQLPPGESTVGVVSDGSVRMRVCPAWR